MTKLLNFNPYNPSCKVKNEINFDDLKFEAIRLKKRGLDSNITEIENLAKTCKLDYSEELPPPPIAMEIRNKGNSNTLFTKGNFSIVTGKPKSRKSFLISLVMAAAIKGDFEDFLYCPNRGTNILFDTEQAKHKVLQTSKRICQLSGIKDPKNFLIYHLRTLDPIERLKVIEHELAITPNLNFVAIDGIIDLEIDPILQANQAQNLISKLMKWSELYKIHIVCVLHYNKSNGSLLGHLGSFAHRKAETVIEVEKSAEDESISIVKAVDCREQEFDDFAFSLDIDGIPNVLKNFQFLKKYKRFNSQKKSKPKAIEPQFIDTATHLEILKEAFKSQKEQSYTELRKSIKQAANHISFPIGDNKVKTFISFYKEKEMINHDKRYNKSVHRINENKLLPD